MCIRDSCRSDGVLMRDDTLRAGVDFAFDWRICLLLDREPEVVRMHVLRDIEDHSIVGRVVLASPVMEDSPCCLAKVGKGHIFQEPGSDKERLVVISNLMVVAIELQPGEVALVEPDAEQ